MSHHIYNTEAIVIGSSEVAEADRAHWLLTQDLGLLVARAQGVRKEESKMRYALQELSITKVSLVEGRAGWRLTGAVLDTSLQVTLKKVGALPVAVKILYFVKRFVPRDENNQKLFKIVKEGLLDLAKKNMDANTTEMFLVASILQELGYLKGDEAVEGRDKGELLADINDAIIHAGL